MNSTHYAKFPILWYDLFLPYFENEFKKTFLSSFPPSLTNSGGIWSHPVVFPLFQFTQCHLCAYIICASTYGSAVCTHIVHSSPLSLLVPTCSSKCFSYYSDHLCMTFSLLLTMLPSLSLISNVHYLNPFLILLTSW
jgi:hypothetical protein